MTIFSGRRPFALLAAALLAAFTVLLSDPRTRQALERRPSHDAGRGAPSWVNRQSDPICRLLYPQRDDLYLAAPSLLRSRQRSDRPFDVWSVDGVNARGDTLVHLTWDAATAALFSVSCEAPLSVGTGESVTLGRQQAVQTTWEWLRDLGFAGDGSRWRLDGEPHYMKAQWRVYWRDARGTVMVWIDAAQGGLLCARRMGSRAGSAAPPPAAIRASGRPQAGRIP